MGLGDIFGGHFLVSYLTQIFGVGIVTSILSTILKSSGRADQAQIIDLIGIIISLFIVINSIKELFQSVQGCCSFLYF